MKSIRLMINLLVVCVVCLLCSSLAQAQATRTWVSGVGDDANPCSRTAPCKTFAGAISKTAPAGEINVLDPGGFGAVTITKSITISSEGFEAGVLVSGTNGIIIAAGNSDVVTLRGLDMNGLNTGLTAIKIQSAGTVHVEKCVIYEFATRGISDERTANGALFVTDTIVKQIGGGGIVVLPGSGTPTIQATLNNVRIENTGLTGPGTGFVTIGANIRGIISQSVLARNATFGIQADSSSKISVNNCWIGYNGAGVDAPNGGEVRISNTVVTFNTGTNVSGNVLSYGNNMLRGNGTDNVPTIQGQQ